MGVMVIKEIKRKEAEKIRQLEREKEKKRGLIDRKLRWKTYKEK